MSPQRKHRVMGIHGHGKHGVSVRTLVVTDVNIRLRRTSTSACAESTAFLCHPLTKEKVVSSKNRSSFLAVTISVRTRWAIFGRRAPFLNMGRLRIGTRYVVSDDHPTKKISTEEKKYVSLPYLRKSSFLKKQVVISRCHNFRADTMSNFRSSCAVFEHGAAHRDTLCSKRWPPHKKNFHRGKKICVTPY